MITSTSSILSTINTSTSFPTTSITQSNSSTIEPTPVAPIIVNELIDTLSAYVGYGFFKFKIPEDTFWHPDFGFDIDCVIDTTSVPLWLSYYQEERLFIGSPLQHDAGVARILIRGQVNGIEDYSSEPTFLTIVIVPDPRDTVPNPLLSLVLRAEQTDSALGSRKKRAIKCAEKTLSGFERADLVSSVARFLALPYEMVNLYDVDQGRIIDSRSNVCDFTTLIGNNQDLSCDSALLLSEKYASGWIDIAANVKVSEYSQSNLTAIEYSIRILPCVNNTSDIAPMDVKSSSATPTYLIIGIIGFTLLGLIITLVLIRRRRLNVSPTFKPRNPVLLPSERRLKIDEFTEFSLWNSWNEYRPPVSQLHVSPYYLEAPGYVHAPVYPRKGLPPPYKLPPAFPGITNGNTKFESNEIVVDEYITTTTTTTTTILFDSDEEFEVSSLTKPSDKISTRYQDLSKRSETLEPIESIAPEAPPYIAAPDFVSTQRSHGIGRRFSEVELQDDMRDSSRNIGSQSPPRMSVGKSLRLRQESVYDSDSADDEEHIISSTTKSLSPATGRSRDGSIKSLSKSTVNPVYRAMRHNNNFTVDEVNGQHQHLTPTRQRLLEAAHMLASEVDAATPERGMIEHK